MKIRQIVKNVLHACLLLFVSFLPVFHNKCLAWYYLFRAYMSFCNQFGIFYKNSWYFAQKHHDYSVLGFPTGQDSATFRDKGTEVPSLSRDKRTTGQAQNLAKGRDGPGQPVKIWDGARDGTVQYFDSCPVQSCGTKQDRAEKDVLKQEKDVLKQKRTFYNRKGCSKIGKWRSKTGNLVIFFWFFFSAIM